MLRIVDRDFLELNNLQRQVLYDEDDVAAGLPKAIAAPASLRRINSQIEIEPIVADVDHTNIEPAGRRRRCASSTAPTTSKRGSCSTTRRVKLGIPWVYGGCIGAEGQTMTILPGETPCLRCLMPERRRPAPRPPATRAGILGPIVNVIASLQANGGDQDLSAATARPSAAR